MTSAKPGNLSYLDRTGLVKPSKEGDPQHPTSVIYSVEQVLQIKVIERLRERLSLQEIRRVLEFLANRNYTPSLFSCNLVMLDKQVYLIEDTCDFGVQVLKASGRNRGQVVIHDVGQIGDVISELREAAIDKVLDFPKRVKGTLLEAGLA